MSKPQRLQLSRRKGFNLQRASRALNGLPAVNVARPSKYGNPFKVGEWGDAANCVKEYRQTFYTYKSNAADNKAMVRKFLRGKNLACWCKPGQPCHADVLLKLANS